MVSSAVLIIVVVVIILGILLSFGLFFLLRNSDTEQTANVLIAPNPLPFASCQTSSQCLTSQICSNGRCTNVVDAVQNNLAATSVAPPPVVVVNRTEEVSVPSSTSSSLEEIERLLERQNGNLQSLQVNLERQIESKLANLENTIISKGVSSLPTQVLDLPPPPPRRNTSIRDLPPPSYVDDDEYFTETPQQPAQSSTVQQPVQATRTVQQPVQSSTVQQPVQATRTVQQPVFNLPLRGTATVTQTTSQPTAAVQQPVPASQPIVLSGATVNPTLNAQPVPVTAPSTVVLAGNANPPRTNNVTVRRNPYANSDDPFDQFNQQDLPPPAILQTKSVKQEKNCAKREVSCPLVPAEVPRCKKNKDRKAVVWQL
ncbi:Transmembrane domain-containing protein [Brazilian cedratvirus IHUMI]|uniref:Transmembrane domain-containing protein n=1 Tax=Brazilian cedratvirus IHUMI TaxID=2126980 RepID=A0A2R8FEN0_9VIRU|nr:Transmembrane domain-containing protein [Brazilian cedratvirus IHUMI]